MKLNLKTGLLFVALASLLFAVTIPNLQKLDIASDQEACLQRMERTGRGLVDYFQINGRMPNTLVQSPFGDTKRSWRLDKELYFKPMKYPDHYEASKPWNSRNNLACANSIDDFDCPCKEKSTDVNYVLVTGVGTAFPLLRNITRDKISDGIENTILLVECKNSGISLAEPKDLDIESMSYLINDRELPSISSNHPGGAHVMFADGHVFFVSNDIKPDELKALLTIAGGEPVTRNELLERGLLK